MIQPQVGIIGGTGIGELLGRQVGGEVVHVDTPFGPPSAPPLVAEWEGVPVAFIPRHGAGHRFHPSVVPYRANIWAMKQLGVTAVLATGATGSLREEIEPGQPVICDQLIDRTFRRDATFFDHGLAVHVEFGEPFCPRLRALLARAAESINADVHLSGTYVCMEGPQFSTRAESLMHRAWGGDLIGMTCCPEAKLAREAELCYACVALPTDYDCWRSVDGSRQAEHLLAEIQGNLKAVSEKAISLLGAALRLLAHDLPAEGRPGELPGCRCGDALRLAIWSERGLIDPALRMRLDPLLGRYLTDNSNNGT